MSKSVKRVDRAIEKSNIAIQYVDSIINELQKVNNDLLDSIYEDKENIKQLEANVRFAQDKFKQNEQIIQSLQESVGV